MDYHPIENFILLGLIENWKYSKHLKGTRFEE